MNLQTVMDLFHNHPELALFFCLGMGYWIGGFKFHKLGLGTVVGTLVTALIVGQADVQLPPMLKSIFFSFFMFATGYSVGPQFFNGLRRGGLQLVVLSVVFTVVGGIAVVLMAKFFGFDKGFAAGLLSGALTQSSVIGTASDAIQRLSMDETVKQQLINHVPIADAVTYLFGTAGAAIFLSKISPWLLRINLAQECSEMEKTMGASNEEGNDFQDYAAFDVQAFRVENDALKGQPISVLEQYDAPRIYVQQMRRHHRVFTPRKELTLRIGDIVVLSGSREVVIKAGEKIGTQVVDKAALEVPLETVPVIVTKNTIAEKTLSQIVGEFSAETQGVHLRKITRQGQIIPRLPNTVIERGDVLDLVGRQSDIDRVAQFIGFVDRPNEKSDLIFIAIACVIGTLIGLLALQLGEITISLGSGGGILIVGVLFGWLHSIFPQYGRVPPPAIWIMETLGLNVFVAAVGLAAATHALEAMQSNGLQLLIAGVFVTLIPHIICLLFGRFVLRMNGGILLGALAGAGTVVAALQAIEDDADSSVPALGFTVPYAINNILLTALGPIIVALV
jgi:putative transport protein